MIFSEYLLPSVVVSISCNSGTGLRLYYFLKSRTSVCALTRNNFRIPVLLFSQCKGRSAEAISFFA